MILQETILQKTITRKVKFLKRYFKQKLLDVTIALILIIDQHFYLFW